MQYKNSEIKIDQLISYLNGAKINLSPAFQRGHVWKLKARVELVKNIALARPIPAIFLYKEADGAKYMYNILDGKQRLESLILFIADGHGTHKIANWKQYFFGPKLRAAAGFKIDYKDKKIAFAKLPDEVIRDFLEYSIPTIEISLTEDTPLDEVVSLFVDINQQGEAVKRFDIVKAMYKDDPLMKDIFELLAREQKRGQNIFYKPRQSVFTRVLKNLQNVQSAQTPNSKVDRMWERLLELALFTRTKKHRSAMAILKDFIAPKTRTKSEPKLSPAEMKELRRAFALVDKISGTISGSRLLTDQTHFYTLITSLIKEPSLHDIDVQTMKGKLARIAAFLGNSSAKMPGTLAADGDAYRQESTKQTTHVARRTKRGELFVKIVRGV